MEERKQFIYQLKLTPRLLKTENWTERENEIVLKHFNQLQQLVNENKVILAGRTLDSDETSFGIVILQSESMEEAEELMLNDPAVKEGIMTAELHPYRVALFNEKFTIQ